jgi:phosphoglycolate phosphatase-like HAD superfamily hydrolase
MSINKLNISELLETVNLFVFDFDGVIADSVHVKTQAFHEIYKKFGKDIAQKVVHHHLSNGGMSRFEKFTLYHHKFLNIQLQEKDLDILCTNFADLVVRKVIDSDEIKGVGAFLDYLLLSRKKSVVNSATPEKELLEIISTRGLSKYFVDIYGSPTSKTENLKLAMKKYNVSNKETLFLGDATADLEAADNLNVKFLGIGKEIYEILLNSKNEYFYLEDFRNII